LLVCGDAKSFITYAKVTVRATGVDSGGCNRARVALGSIFLIGEASGATGEAFMIIIRGRSRTSMKQPLPGLTLSASRARAVILKVVILFTLDAFLCVSSRTGNALAILHGRTWWTRIFVTDGQLVKTVHACYATVAKQAVLDNAIRDQAA